MIDDIEYRSKKEQAIEEEQLALEKKFKEAFDKFVKAYNRSYKEDSNLSSLDLKC